MARLPVRTSKTPNKRATIPFNNRRARNLLLICAALLIAALWLNAPTLQRWSYNRKTTAQLLEEARRSPDNLALVETAGQRLLETERADEASTLLMPVVQRHPENTQLNLLAGRAALQQGNLQLSGALFNTAFQAEPHNPDALYWSAELLYKRGQKKFAEQLLNDVTRVAPERADAWQRLGQIALQAQDYVTALEKLNQAEQREPTSETALLRAEALRNLGRLPDAETAAREAIKREPSAPAYALLGQIVQASPGDARLQESQSYLKKAVALSPKNSDLLKLLALNYRAAGQHKLAIKVLRHLIRQQPAMSEIYLLLGQSYAASGKPLLARRTLEIFNLLAPLQQKADAARHRVIIERGSLPSQLAQVKVLLQLGRQDLARDVLERAWSKAPNNSEIKRLAALADKTPALKIPPLPPDAEGDAP